MLINISSYILFNIISSFHNTARNQQKAEQEINILETEIAKRDQDLLNFQVSLNDAEYLLVS